MDVVDCQQDLVYNVCCVFFSELDIVLFHFVKDFKQIPGFYQFKNNVDVALVFTEVMNPDYVRMIKILKCFQFLPH